MTQYYIYEGGRQVGPFPKDQLIRHGLTANSMVWSAGMPDWAPAYTVTDLRDILPPPGSVPPPYPYGATDILSDTGTSGKSRLAFGLFAIFLGCLGIQYFYVGKNTAGIISIILGLVSCGLWSIVTLIQGILVLVMSQPAFEQKYVYSPSTFPVF